MNPVGDLAGVGRQMVVGAAWTVSLRMAVRLLGLLSMVVLARLLTPADFGLVALATACAAALELLGAFSFDVWLIRHRDPQRAHYDTVWTLSLLRGVATAAALMLLAVPMARFFDEPRLAPVLVALAAVSVVDGLRNVGAVDFVKHLRFDRDFLLMAGPRLGAFVVTVGLAAALRNHWALVAGIAAGQALGVLLSFTMHPYRPRPCLLHWREAFNFSKWLLAANLASFAYERAGTFILGKLAGSQGLGLYTVSREISNLASSELVMPLRRVMLPGYSKMTAEVGMLRRAFVDGFALIVLVGLPCAAGIAAVADPLVRVLLGPQWLEAIPVIQILALYSVCAVAVANQSPLLVAMGHVRLIAALTALGVVVLVPSFAWASSRHGIHGGAAALGLTHLLVLVVSLGASLRLLSLSPLALAEKAWRSVAATLAMAATVASALDAMQGAPQAVTLAVGVAVGAATYALALLALWRLSGAPPGPERMVLEFLRHRRPVPTGAPGA